MSNRRKLRVGRSDWKFYGEPRVSRSPVTGDFGLPIHPWLRMNDELLGIFHPTVMFDVAELRAQGYEPEALGFVPIRDEVMEIPVASIDADMKSRYDIDLYEPDPPDMKHPIRIIGGMFDDPHSDEWWQRVHEERDLFLIAGDTPTLVRRMEAGQPADLPGLLESSFIGRVRGLVIRAYETGVGTTMPGG